MSSQVIFQGKGDKMGLLKDLAEGFANGFLSATVDGLRAGRPQGQFQNGPALAERFCRELGWSVDEREGDVVLLHFNDPVIGRRKVAITGGDTLLTFRVWSAATMSARQIPGEIMGHLLVRNWELALSAWHMFDAGNGNAAFALASNMLVAGLDAPVFKHVCETMVREANAFDVKMKAAGLL
jgi:hypothetical protein